MKDYNLTEDVELRLCLSQVLGTTFCSGALSIGGLFSSKAGLPSST